MATSLLTLLDDIAVVLDDVAVMTKVAARKTAGVLGDDLALNANQVAGVRADRELPVVWAVAKGSAVNKAILVPVALAISTFAPWLITPLLMLGGLYLCYEGVEKLAHRFLHPAEDEARKAKVRQAASDSAADPAIDMKAFEQEKVKGAIRTDFILSAEIIVISLGTMTDADLMTRLGVLVAISVLMTVGVYGLVAGIVKLDDLGRWMTGQPAAAGGAIEERSGPSQAVGRGILWFAPILMKLLSIVGTAAMFLVGGGILTHGVHWFSERIADASASVSAALPGVAQILGSLTSMLLQGLVGILAGAIVLGLVTVVKKVRGKPAQAGSHQGPVKE